MGNSSAKPPSPSYSIVGAIYQNVFLGSSFMKETKFATPSFDLSNRVYIVTGGSKGIGKCVVEQLAKQKATVHFTCRDMKTGIQTADELSNQTGGRVFAHKCDMSSVDAIKEFCKNFMEENSRLDGLVNNAGGMATKWYTNPDGIEMTSACHVLGVFTITTELFPILKDGGRVVTVTSAGCYNGKLDPFYLANTINPGEHFDGLKSYVQAKRGQIVLTDMLAELGEEQGTKVTVMHPGWCKSDGLNPLVENMPSFGSKVDKFRTAESGADTITWLITTDEPVKQGEFYYEREKAKKHAPLAHTHETKKDREHLWSWLCSLTGRSDLDPTKSKDEQKRKEDTPKKPEEKKEENAEAEASTDGKEEEAAEASQVSQPEEASKSDDDSGVEDAKAAAEDAKAAAEVAVV